MSSNKKKSGIIFCLFGMFAFGAWGAWWVWNENFSSAAIQAKSLQREFSIGASKQEFFNRADGMGASYLVLWEKEKHLSRISRHGSFEGLGNGPHAGNSPDLKAGPGVPPQYGFQRGWLRGLASDDKYFEVDSKENLFRSFSEAAEGYAEVTFNSDFGSSWQVSIEFRDQKVVGVNRLKVH